jgi:hypothetical protein
LKLSQNEFLHAAGDLSPAAGRENTMKKILALVIFLGAAAFFTSDIKAQSGNCYSAYTETGIHLIISDNGTPGDFDDDFICDWETNITFSIIH